MPKNALVTIKYGPYRSCGVVEHRTFRLEGLQAVLEADGHRIILEEIPDWNEVQLVVNGEMIFQCNINDLDFGGKGVLDPLCQAARLAVLNAY
ncbi:hypothetical protein JRQ81_017366 [Phrynocephalus forsythii]|uniref:Uncharacterized protein n=1 Tax=Phrynocephalus forsythii TaxID=171643 RepID=A0A9Q0XQ70_9SAUR|nr:hypothetical protein JRQ81_017366 [Phrynocephalus forsythii]